ncbi:MAG: hypothetical protein Q7R87_03570 [Nanoarchaeota archaeon]|nr:hypothetical protein [Nanoarchaeota archaeon]
MEESKNHSLLVVVHPFYLIPMTLARQLNPENFMPDYTPSYKGYRDYLENMVSLIRNHQGSLLCLEEDFIKRDLLKRHLSVWRGEKNFRILGTKDDRAEPIKGWEEFDSITDRHKDKEILCAGGQYYIAHSKGKDFEAGCLGTVVKRIREKGYNPLLVKEAIFS